MESVVLKARLDTSSSTMTHSSKLRTSASAKTNSLWKEMAAATGSHSAMEKNTYNFTLLNQMMVT